MPDHVIGDVMTRQVVSATPDTPVGKIAELLHANRISAVPVTDDRNRVLGVVSAADLLPRIATSAVPFALRRRRVGRAAAAARAGELMRTPPVVIGQDAPLAAAAKKMRARNVKRLVVTDAHGRLRGIVSRTDLLRPLSRPDDDIAGDVADALRRTMWIDRRQVQVDVDAGAVTLTGAVGRRTTGAIVARLAAEVPGVTAVNNHIRYDFDDTKLARSRVHRTHPLSAEPFRP